ncbi:hypothetical protein HUT17_04860 (plasmid) [Nocardiopsis flavescens]|nr:hypothetical protein HUT17_04860 [Nocardiopsis flavescens]
MTAFDPDRELTDDELDAVLAAADSELLNHIETTSTPFDLLLNIMAQEARLGVDQLLAVEVLHGDSAVEVIKHRHHERLLTRAIRNLRPIDALLTSLQVKKVVATLNKARQAEGDRRVRALQLAVFVMKGSDELLSNVNKIIRDTAHLLSFPTSMNTLGLDLELHLTKAVGRSRHLTAALDGARRFPDSEAIDQACDHAQILENLLTRVDNLVRVLHRDLDLDRGNAAVRAYTEATLDVSGADLSHLTLGQGDLADMTGVVWSQETRWPSNFTVKLRRLSREIRPGVYQVQGGGGHDRLDLGIFS